MRTGKHSLTPLAAVAAGLLAGAVGTVGLDAVQYLRYRRRGGTESPLAWEFAPIETWAKAPAPGQVARRVIEGFTQRKLPDRWAFPISTAMHWGYGSSAGAAYGILAGSLRRPRAAYGLPLGATVWALGYVILPEGGLYKPIWQYDAETLAWDLSGHPRLRRHHRNHLPAPHQDPLAGNERPTSHRPLPSKPHPLTERSRRVTD